MTDTDNVFERKAREIINWTVSEGTRDFSALLSAIASALKAEREALEAEVTLHKEIAEAREFDFHEAEKRIAELEAERDQNKGER